MFVIRERLYVHPVCIYCVTDKLEFFFSQVLYRASHCVIELGEEVNLNKMLLYWTDTNKFITHFNLSTNECTYNFT